MYKLKKKYLVKIISFFLGLALVIAGLILNERSLKQKYEKEIEKQQINVISNICALTGAIESSFTKSLSVGSFDSEKLNISINSYTVRNLLYLCNNSCEKTASFFLELSNYAKTDMQDTAKNAEYADILSKITKIFLSSLNSNNAQKAIVNAENLFSTDQDDYENILQNIEKKYSTLENRVQADRQAISSYAKTILGMPFSVSLFKGNYIYPKAISYSAKNAYANIFVSGKTLLIMSEEDNKKESEINSVSAEKAKEELIKYAPYAADFTLIHEIEKEGLIYYLFCPTENNGEKTVINYDESIKIVLSKYTGETKAFDATKYLKNCPSVPDGIFPQNTDASQTVIIINNGYYFETKSQTQPVIYTITDTTTLNTRHFTQDEYFLFLS